MSLDVRKLMGAILKRRRAVASQPKTTPIAKMLADRPIVGKAPKLSTRPPPLQYRSASNM